MNNFTLVLITASVTILGFMLLLKYLQKKQQNNLIIPPRQETLKDCPQCGLPAEQSEVMLRVNYDIRCLGEHDDIPVTEVWMLR